MSASTPVPLLDLKAQYRTIKSEVSEVLQAVCDSQWFIGGPEVTGLEKEVAAYCGAKHGVGVSSGTDGEIVGLMALGLQPGDEVITTPYTFFATVGGIVRVGAKPVFVDIDPVTFNIDTSKIEEKITDKTKCIMPVHLYGQCADMDPILELAEKYKLNVAEDSAQAIGAKYKGRMAGAIGDWSWFSFFPSKNLGCFGDGGMVTTNDPAFAEKVTMLRNHGAEPKYYHKLVGGNFRLDAMQAAILRVKLRHLEDWHQGRRANAKKYDALFVDAGIALSADKPFVERCEAPVVLPAGTEPNTALTEQKEYESVVNQYCIRVRNRDVVREKLQKAEIGCEVYYPVPLHLQECFASLGYSEGDFPESERAAKESLAIPVYPELTDAQQEQVVSAIKDAVAG